MGSRHHPDFYDAETAAMMERVFNDIWRTVSASDVSGEAETDDELSETIIQRLLALLDEGITDPNELRQRALMELLPPPSAR